MRLKGFDHIGMNDSGEVEVDTKALEAEAEAAKKESVAPAPGGKAKAIDRRQKLAPKPKAELGPGDVEVTSAHIEAARDELWSEGNHNPTEQQILDRARAGVFSTMPDEEVAARAIDAILVDEKSAKEIVEKTNKGIKDSVAAAEENARKWEEVDREGSIEQERKLEEEERVGNSLRNEEMSREIRAKALRRIEENRKWEEADRVAALEQEREQAKSMVTPQNIEREDRVHIERIEQKRKREEARRVEAIEQDRKREEEARVKSLKIPSVLKNLIFRKDDGAARRASAAAEKERIEQDRKKEEALRVESLKATEKAKDDKPDTLREIIFGKK